MCTFIVRARREAPSQYTIGRVVASVATCQSWYSSKLSLQQNNDTPELRTLKKFCSRSDMFHTLLRGRLFPTYTASYQGVSEAHLFSCLQKWLLSSKCLSRRHRVYKSKQKLVFGSVRPSKHSDRAHYEKRQDRDLNFICRKHG